MLRGGKKMQRKSELWVQAEIERGWSQAELPAAAAAASTAQGVLAMKNKEAC